MAHIPQDNPNIPTIDQINQSLVAKAGQNPSIEIRDAAHSATKLSAMSQALAVAALSGPSGFGYGASKSHAYGFFREAGTTPPSGHNR